MVNIEVWAKDFGDKLAIRSVSQHRACSTCCRYKLLIKKLSNDRYAKAVQVRHYGRHLDSQYADRVRYWRARACSRLPATTAGTRQLCCIMDGMDRSKFKFPRSQALQASKTFGNFSRPTLDTYGLIAHGELALLAQSLPMVAKDSNFCCDVLAFVMHHLIECGRLEGRATELIIQSDNTCREVKNNSVLRQLGLWTALQKVSRAELRMLRSGHSHEDVDAWFGQLSYWLQAQTELHVPADFTKSLSNFMEKDGARPHESRKLSIAVNRVRDWRLDSARSFLCASHVF